MLHLLAYSRMKQCEQLMYVQSRSFPFLPPPPKDIDFAFFGFFFPSAPLVSAPLLLLLSLLLLLVLLLLLLVLAAGVLGFLPLFLFRFSICFLTVDNI